jgi:hypothetical protein
VTSDVGIRPLGVRPNVPLTDDQLRTLQVLQDYDLTPVKRRLLKDGAMPSTWVDEAILEFRRYLGLRVVSDKRINMFSKQIDDVWHTCLLFSRLYADYCDEAFGHFVHHDPEMEDVPPRESQRRWTEFVQAYSDLYGAPGKLWRPPSA